MTARADIARTRQGLYRFLGGAFLAPSDDRFGMLADAVAILDGRDLDDFAFSRDWRRMTRHFPIDVASAGLDISYVRLFASGMSDYLCPPTESFYRVQAKGGGIGEFTAELQREYHSTGIVPDAGGEAPDHISTEFEAMALLCSLEGVAWEDRQTESLTDLIESERRFLDTHLAVWLPLFRGRVHAARPPAFYRDLVDAAHAYVVHEADYVRAIRRGVTSL